MLPKYLTRAKDSISKRGYKQEDIAKKTLCSGRFFDKADINLTMPNDEYKVDVKLVVNQKSYSLSLKEIDKLYKDCTPKTPALMIYLGDYIIEAIIKRK